MNKSKNYLFLFMIGVIQLSLSGQRNGYNLFFANGQTELTEASKATIRAITNKVVKGQHYSFYPLTYDSVYKKYAYAKIALQQAKAIANYAESVGFKLANVPKNFPSSFKGYSIGVNMRYILNKDSLTPSQEKQLLYNPLKDRFAQKPSQFFTINPLRDTTLVGVEGTILDLVAGSLLSNRPVKVELVEYYKKGDLIKNGLSTSSNRQLIESGGTIFLDAKDAQNPKRQVSLNTNKGIDVSFASKKKKDMQIFTKDPKRPTEMNWVTSSAPTYQIRRLESWQVTETIYDEEGEIVSKKSFNSKEEWEKYQKQQQIEAENRRKAQELAEEKRKREQEEQRKEALIAQKNKSFMNDKMKVNNLGFINCDRFIDQEMVSFSINLDKTVNAEYYIVFEDINGVISGYKDHKKANFGRAPLNAQATLVAVAFIGAQAYFYKTALKINKNSPVQVKLKPVKESYVDQQLGMLK